MGHFNSCQALQIFQGCTPALPKCRWSWVPENRHLTTHRSQKCGLNNRLLRIHQSGILKKFNVRARNKDSKNQSNKSTSRSKSILVTPPSKGPSAPTLSDTPLANEDSSSQVAAVASFEGFRIFKQFPKKILRLLASLPLAIGELFVLAGLMALGKSRLEILLAVLIDALLYADFYQKECFNVNENFCDELPQSVQGTLIDQGESPEYYFQRYPEDHPVLGFLTWRWVLGLNLDHVYTAPYFLGLLVLLAASLMACTTTTQFPMVKVARRWSFMKSGSAILKLDVADSLPRARIQDLGVLLMGMGYEVFVNGPSLYGFKGLAGRLAPIGVHGALLLIMAGATLSSTGGYRGLVTVPQGLNFMIGDVLAPNGILSRPISSFDTEIHVNKFYIDYHENGEVAQFHSDLSLRDLNGKEVLKKTISVNDPLRFGGVTIYQTDWSISALQLHKDGAGPFNLAMATLQSGDKKLFGTFLPLEDNSGSTKPKGISILARDLQSVVLYDQEGKFVGVRRPGSNRPIIVDGVNIVVDDAIGSTGLELKVTLYSPPFVNLLQLMQDAHTVLLNFIANALSSIASPSVVLKGGEDEMLNIDWCCILCMCRSVGVMDPGVPVVYAGFGALMLTTSISYLSHSQVWALQEGTSVVVGGKSNRAKQGFTVELNRILDSLPEIVGNGNLENKEIASLEDNEVSSRSEHKLENIRAE
eukprot:Gb_26769 [translate_table: standard]